VVVVRYSGANFFHNQCVRADISLSSSGGEGRGEEATIFLKLL